MSPAYRCLHLERDAASQQSSVAILRFNRPESLNALSPDMCEEFKEALHQLRKDPSVRCLVLTGTGRAFSAGGDFNFLQERMRSTVVDNVDALQQFYSTFLGIRELPFPTIAAVNGPAVGGGACLAMACDIRLAAKSARIGFNFVKLGLTPGMAATYLLPTLTNHQVASRLLLTGDIVPSDEAQRLGLVLSVHDDPALMPEALKLARSIASASQAAVSATLGVLRSQCAAGGEALQRAVAHEAQMQAECFVGQDVQEGVAAAMERRAPVFATPIAIGHSRISNSLG
jgi:enoyl-CoA hydratase/carnithine racemase